MRVWIAVGLAALASACTGVEPVDPPMMGANEMQPRPGAFSGPAGDFVVLGNRTWEQGNAEEKAEVGAGL